MDTNLNFVTKQSLKPGQQVTWGGGSCRAVVLDEDGVGVRVELTHDAESVWGEISYPKGTVAVFPSGVLRLLS